MAIQGILYGRLHQVGGEFASFAGATVQCHEKHFSWRLDEATVDLRKLRHVLALAEAENFARAADSVHLSQPAFSRSIQSLEQELGVALFERGKRKVTPTPFGDVVVDRARKLIWEATGLRRDIEMMKASELGEVSFGLGPMPAAMLLVPVLTRLMKESPGIRTRVEIMHWRHLLQLLEAEQLDFFIADCRELASNERLSIVLLRQFPINFFCRSGHAILRKKGASAQELLAYPLGAFKLPTVALAGVTHCLGFSGDPAKMWTLQCDNLLVAERVASNTDLIIIGPENAFRAELQRKNIVEVPLNPPLNLTTHFGVVTLRERILSPAAELLIKLAINEVGALDTRRGAR